MENITKPDRRTEKRITGDMAEDAVAKYMQNRGYRLVARNYTVHNVGELDLVFEKGGEIYVTEVRSRRNTGPYPISSETVDFKKRKKLMRTTRYFLSNRGYDNRNVVFLIGSVTHDRNGIIQNVEILPF